MVHKRRIQIKNFDCGHKGLGKFCHLCQQLEKGILIKDKNGKYIPNKHYDDKTATSESLIREKRT